MFKLKLADYSSSQLSVFLVDGKYIRDNIFLDFTEGGNYLRYDWIPENEIWLGGIHIIECKEVLIHELSEVLYALENHLDIRNSEDDYDIAHDHANETEQATRDAPNTADAILAELLDKYSNRKPEEEVTLWET